MGQRSNRYCGSRLRTVFALLFVGAAARSRGGRRRNECRTGRVPAPPLPVLPRRPSDAIQAATSRAQTPPSAAIRSSDSIALAHGASSRL